MPLLLPNVIENDTPADAAEVQQNYGVTQQFVNTNVIQRDGSVAMQAPLTLFGTPSADLHATTKAYVDALLPVGVIMPYGGAVAPAGRWALCNGATLSTADYPVLFSVLGYRYGGSGGSFIVPNLAGRMMIGVDPVQSRFDTTGKAGGSFAAVNAPHTHAINHDHGSVTSAGASARHTHSISHQHTINHDHGAATTASSGHHTHPGRASMTAQAGTNRSIFTTPTGADPVTTMTGGDGDHTHSVNLPAFAGLSGWNSVASSGNDSPDHTHAVNLPAFTGASGSSGEVGAEQIPPYVIMSYIIRLD